MVNTTGYCTFLQLDAASSNMEVLSHTNLKKNLQFPHGILPGEKMSFPCPLGILNLWGGWITIANALFVDRICRPPFIEC